MKHSSSLVLLGSGRMANVVNGVCPCPVNLNTVLHGRSHECHHSRAVLGWQLGRLGEEDRDHGPVSYDNHRNNIMNRRTLILSTIALASCGQQPPDQLKADIEALAIGLGGILTDLQAIPGVHLTPTQTAAIQTELDIIKQNAAIIAAAATPNGDAVAAISAAVSALVPLVSQFYPQAPAVAAVMQAALALVPVVLALVGQRISGAAPRMAPEAAVKVLKARGR